MNITEERKRLARELHNSHEMFHAIINTIPQYVLWKDRESRYRGCNKAFAELAGLSSPAAVAGMMDADALSEKNADQHVREDRQVMESNAPILNLEELVTTQTGKQVWIRKSKMPLFDQDGAVLGILCIFEDITEPRRQKAELVRTNDQLRALIRSSPLAITILDAEGRVELWNPAAVRVFGWTEEEVLGRPLPTVPASKREEHAELRGAIMRGESFTNREVTRIRKDGSPVIVNLSTAPIHNDAGRITGILGIMDDVTQMKQMQQHAQRLESMSALGQLLSGVAHELKNPLFILTGHAQLMHEHLTAGDLVKAEMDLEKIQHASEAMQRVTNRFLHLARPIQSKKERCRVDAILDQTLQFLDNELLKRQIVVIRELEELPLIWSDSKQLQQVFLNIMLNAIQAMAAHGHGTLTVKAIRLDDCIEVSIRDDGPGIKPEYGSQLFQPFFSTKPPEEGTGLGLWTAREILTRLGGAVTFETEIGIGTTFLVRLPLKEPPTS